MVSRLKCANLTAILMIGLIGILSACGGSNPPLGTAAAPGTPVVALEGTASPGVSAPQRTATRTPRLSPTPSAVPTLAVTSSRLRGLKIQFWYVGAAADAVGRQADLFNSANEWGIQVQALALPGYGDLAEALAAALAVDSLPDLLVAYDDAVSGWQNRLVDLNQFYAAPRWGFGEAERGDFYDIFWGPSVGERLSLPFKRSGWVLFYNQTWAEALGFTDPPLTPRDFSKQACAAAAANAQDDRRDNDGTGGWVISTDPATLLAWVYAFGGEVQASDGGYRFASPEAASALRFLRQLTDDGCAWAASSAHPNDEFAARKALFIASSTGGIADQQAAMQSAGNGDAWTVLPFPAETGLHVVVASGPSLMITASGPDRQLAAWIFARWLSSAENQAQRVRADGGYPTRKAARTLLDDYARQNPPWAVAAGQMNYLRPEPTDPSWNVVRWAASDALGQVFTMNFNGEQIPAVLALLDQIAKEAQVQNP